MRDRRKKHLTERLSACEDIMKIPQTEDFNFLTSIENPEYIDTESFFQNSNPIHLEIGCGKGKFICETAKRNPDINYIAVEKIGNVIVMAGEAVKRENLSNVLLLKCDAHMLPKYIKENSIERIYLNFSCPYPKNRDKNKRLTYPAFLNIYKKLLSENGEIHQKTDNMHFFEFSIEQFSQNGFALKNISLDLHNSDFAGNIVTEYEKRFSDLGQPIYRLEAYIK